MKVDTSDIQKLLDVFAKNYILVPLEVFADDPYKTLISTLLSARTRDELTLEVCNKLFKEAPDINTLGSKDVKTIEKLIYPVGFYKTKAKHIKKLCVIINTKFKGKIPETREELMSLPGVGRKTANLVLNRAFHKPAIAVDTHVHRISNMLHWVNTKTPEQTEQELNKIIPQEYWKNINRYMVSIGRQYRSKRQLEEFLRENKLLKN